MSSPTLSFSQWFNGQEERIRIPIRPWPVLNSHHFFCPSKSRSRSTPFLKRELEVFSLSFHWRSLSLWKRIASDPNRVLSFYEVHALVRVQFPKCDDVRWTGDERLLIHLRHALAREMSLNVAIHDPVTADSSIRLKIHHDWMNG